MKDKEFMMKYAQTVEMADIVRQMGKRIPRGELLIAAGDFFEDYVEMASAYFPAFFEELKREFELKRLALLHENKID
jgi:acyl carrier protein phosphodiesterase